MGRIDTAAERAKLAALEGHTPGPWYSDASVVGTMIDDRYEWSHIASIGEVDRHHKSEKAANTRLITASPDIKDTLSAALDEIDRLRAALEDILDGEPVWHDGP